MRHKLRTRRAFKNLDESAALADDIIVDSRAECVNESGIRERLTIGCRSTIIGSIHVAVGGSIRIEEGFYLGRGAHVHAVGPVTIGKNVVLSENVSVFDGASQRINPVETVENLAEAPLLIGDQAWIGYGARIPNGVIIGRGAVVTPHSVVVSDVPPFAMVSGNPAKVIKMLKKPHAPFAGKRFTVDGADITWLMHETGRMGMYPLLDEADRRYETAGAFPQKEKIFGKTTTDSLALAVIRILMLLSSVVTTILLSRAFSLSLYGTYSQGLTIVSMALSLSTLGMLDAANYFINSKPTAEKQAYINTIFAIVVMAGSVTASVILLFQQRIYAYFNNPGLSAIIIFVALRPLWELLINALQILYISVGKAKSIAFRNIVASALRLLFAFLAARLTGSLEILFVGQLLIDIVTVGYLWISLAKEGTLINPLRLAPRVIAEILRFSIPMGLHSLTKIILADMDKLFIGRFESTARYALYASASSPVPYDMISNAFLLIIFPILTRYFAEGKIDPARRMVSGYIKISYLTNITFSVAVLLVAREFVLFLYGEKYLPGVTIFSLYVWVDVIRTLNMTTILSAKGWVKTLMCMSLGTVVLDFVLNVLMYRAMGFVGPALTTVVSTLITTAITCALSGKALRISFLKLLDVKALLLFLMQTAAIGVLSLTLRNWLRAIGAQSFTVLVTVGGVFVGGMLMINAKRMLSLFREMNAFKL